MTLDVGWTYKNNKQVGTHPDMTLDVVGTENSNKRTVDMGDDKCFIQTANFLSTNWEETVINALFWWPHFKGEGDPAK